MLSLYLKKITLLFPLLLFTSLFSNDNSKCTNMFDQGYEVPQNRMLHGYNYPARIDTKEWDVFIAGSYIYWETRERGLELGVPISTPNDILNVDFEYKSGFKVKFGFSAGRDNWTVNFEYLRFHPNIKTSFNRPNNASNILSYWRPDRVNPTATSISSDLKIDLDFIDFEIGRSNYVGKSLIFKPFAGLRGGWLDQTYKVTLNTISLEIPTVASSDSWLIGPRIGIDTNWFISKVFKIFGNFASSLVYQNFDKIRLEESNSTNPSALVRNFKNKQYFLTPMADVLLGIGWGSYFANNNANFDLTLGYEIKYIWNQNTMATLVSIIDNLVRTPEKPDNLMFHGLTAALRFDF